MQWTFFGQKKTLSLSGLFRNLIPENECRFLSDKRPAHVFYEFKTPATIAAVEESMNKLRRLPFLILLAPVRSSICLGAKALCRNELQNKRSLRPALIHGHNTTKNCVNPRSMVKARSDCAPVAAARSFDSEKNRGSK